MTNYDVYEISEELAEHFGTTKDEVTFIHEEVVIIDGNTYAIYPEEEAEEAVKEHLKESLWAVNADFLADYTGVDWKVFQALSGLYEEANDAILALIESNGSLEDFTQKVIKADGRGAFLSGYDGQEIEIFIDGAWFYLYREE